MKVAVGSNNPVKKQAVHNTFSKVFGKVEVIMRSVDSGVPSQPRGDAVVAAPANAQSGFEHVFQTWALASALNLVSLTFLA
jgi:non-canonical (house-cleaning) NTP pyrophosphatase